MQRGPGQRCEVTLCPPQALQCPESSQSNLPAPETTSGEGIMDSSQTPGAEQGRMPPGHAAESAVPAGCYIKAPQAAWLTHNILTSHSNREPGWRSGCPRGSGESRLLGCRLPSSAVSSRGRRDKRNLWGLPYKGTHSIDGGSTLITYSPPKGPPLGTITWVLGFKHVNFGDPNI